jgi:hypothetical protein
VPHGLFFAHHWFVATNDSVDADQLRDLIDQKLRQLNDDYDVERRHALQAVDLTVLTEENFLDFMAAKGKMGGQHKFPRVLKGAMLNDWLAFLQSRNLLPESSVVHPS